MLYHKDKIATQEVRQMVLPQSRRLEVVEMAQGSIDVAVIYGSEKH